MRMTAQIVGMARYLSPDVDIEIESVALRYDFIKSIVPDFDRFLAVDGWIADAITRDVSGDDLAAYYPTIALANMVLRDFGPRNASGLPGPRANALLYPSVAIRLRAMNVCMEPETAIRTYSPERAWTFKYEGIDFNASVPRAKIRLLNQTKPIGHAGSVDWGYLDRANTETLFAGAISTKASIEFV